MKKYFILFLTSLCMAFMAQAQFIELPMPAIDYLGKSQKGLEIKELKKNLKSQGIKMEAQAKNIWISTDGKFGIWFVEIDKEYICVKIGAKEGVNFPLTSELRLTDKMREAPEMYFEDQIYVRKLYSPSLGASTIGFRDKKAAVVKINDKVVYAKDDKGFYYIHDASVVQGNDEPSLLDYFPEFGNFDQYVSSLGYTPETFFPRIKIVPGKMECAKYGCQNDMGRVNLSDNFYFYGSFRNGMAHGKGTFHYDAEDGTYSSFTAHMSHGMPNDWFVMKVYKSRASKKAKEAPLAKYEGTCAWGEFVGRMEFSDKRLLMEGSFVFAPRENRREKPVRHFPGYFWVESGLSEFEYAGPGYMFPICFSSIAAHDFDLDNISQVSRLKLPNKKNKITGQTFTYPCLMSQGEMLGGELVDGKKPFVTAACYYNRYFDQPEHGKPAPVEVTGEMGCELLEEALRTGMMSTELLSDKANGRAVLADVMSIRQRLKDNLAIDPAKLHLLNATSLQQASDGLQYGLLIEGPMYSGKSNYGTIDLLMYQDDDGLRIGGFSAEDVEAFTTMHMDEWEKALKELVKAAQQNFDPIKGEKITRDSYYRCYAQASLKNQLYYTSNLQLPEAKDCRLIGYFDGLADSEENDQARSFVAQFLRAAQEDPEKGRQIIINLFTGIDYVLKERLDAELVADEPVQKNSFVDIRSKKQYRIPGLPEGYLLTMGYEKRIFNLSEWNLYLRVEKEKK